MSGQHVQTLGVGHRGGATSVTSSVWDTRPSAKGSSSAVAGAARMLRPGHRGQPRAWDWLGQQVVLKPQALRGTETDAPAASLAGTKGTRGAAAASSDRGRGGWGAVTSRRAGRGRLAVGPPEAGEVSSGRRGRQEAARDGTGRPGPGARGPARPRGRHSPLQGGQLEALGAELDEGPQVRLAHAAYGVDVGAGAVVLGQVAEEAGGKGNTGVPCGGPEGCRPANVGGTRGGAAAASDRGGRRLAVPEGVWGGRRAWGRLAS